MPSSPGWRRPGRCSCSLREMDMDMDSRGTLIMDTYRNPRYRYAQEDSDLILEEVNRSCGDRVQLYVRFRRDTAVPGKGEPGQGDSSIPTRAGSEADAPVSGTERERVIGEISFQGEGCSVCLSSAELLCRFARGRGLGEIQRSARAFESFLTVETEGGQAGEPGIPEELSVFRDLQRFPMRQKCALMAWRMMATL